MDMKFASRPAFITVKKSVMKLDQDGEPMPSSNASDRPEPPQMDAPTRVRPFSVGKLRDLVEQAKEQQKAPAAAISVSRASTTPVVLPPAVATGSTSILRTPVKGSIVAAAALLVFAGIGLTFVLMPKQAQVAAPAVEPPPAVAAAAPPADPAAAAPAASAAGFVFTEPVVLLPGAAPEAPRAAAAPPAAPAAPAAKAPEKAAPTTPEKHHAAADKPPPAPVAKAPEAKPDPKAPPAAAGNEMDEMRRIQQMANSQLDKSIH